MLRHQTRSRCAGTERHAVTGGSVSAIVLARLGESRLFQDYQHAFVATFGLPLLLCDAEFSPVAPRASASDGALHDRLIRSSKTCAVCPQWQVHTATRGCPETRSRTCQAGLTVTAVPLRLGHTVMGYLLTGQERRGAPAPRKFPARSATLRAPGSGLGPARRSDRVTTTELTAPRYRSVIQFVTIFAQHLVVISNQLLIQAGQTDSPAIKKGRLYIGERHSDDLRLTDVARALNMSTCYFSRVFKSATGLTFTEYLARTRIESFKHMLLNVHLRISEAAYATGFQSLSQFNRVFRRIEGETPGSYRDRLHGVNRHAPRCAVLVCAA